MGKRPPETTGSRVRYYRDAAGMTKERLAYSSGLSLATINRVEADQHDSKVSTLSQIADALGVTTAALLVEGS